MYLYGNGYSIYISNFVIIDERKEKRKIKCVMIDETMMIKYATDNMLNNKIKLLYSNRIACSYTKMS
jgi:hypothetical protein